MKKIGVFTSGGDSPGMNACIRAVVRTACYNQLEVIGIMRGYQGMIENELIQMNSRSVSNIIQRGGTILKTARSAEFLTPEGRQKAYQNLLNQGIEGLVCIGGDGSFRGAMALYEEHGIPTIGTPGTIDNDVNGTDFTLGFDTAVHTALDAIDKIRDTAESHSRIFFVEVMGRKAGDIALWVGTAGGAETILVPEAKNDWAAMINMFRRSPKSFSIVIVAEGDEDGGAYKIVERIQQHLPEFDPRVTILGHIQRGGSPSPLDRVLGSRMGVAAVEALMQGEVNKMVGVVNNQILLTPFGDATSTPRTLNPELLRLVQILNS
ncbi:MAG: 6-phosphofructokinase [Bacteroidia bacterium]|jgi:6-phosphofructokinase 1